MKKRMQNSKLTAKDIAVLGMMTASLEAVKLAFSFLPNVELVTLLIIVYTVFAGRKVLLAVFAFVGIECLIWGFGVWTVMYLYIWPLLAAAVLVLRRQQSVWFYSTLSGVFGLLFGAMCAIPYFFIGGVKMALTWWIAGIPFDILHGISNFVVCLFLFVPLEGALRKIESVLYQ